jgi:UDP-N-acetylmuramoyl-L-alanyl-D-glutamate--2,6-diaminopimelate ligase
MADAASTGGDRWTRVGEPEGPVLDGARSLEALLDRWANEGRLVGQQVPAGTSPATDATNAIHLAGIRDDSRRVDPGTLFVAVRGLRVDGHDFVGEAIARGASAVAVERSMGDLPVPQLLVDRGAAALASAAAWWYGDPSRELLTVGVTGTNGKTTTSFLAAAGLAGAGFATGLIGTVGIRIGGRLVRNDEPNTTPGSLDLQRLLRSMRLAGEEAAVIETSSHGLAADRVASVDYDAAIFTNLSHEHLDFHGTFDAYRWAKLSLFERLPQHGKSGRPGLGVINADDPHANAFVDATRGAKALPVTYGRRAEADVHLASLSTDATGSTLEVEIGESARSLHLRIPGSFNAHNATAVLALAHGLGLDLDAVSAALEAVGGVPGRMERVDMGQPFMVVIDYAHTPGALDAILRELEPLAAPDRGVISVFGASGERDVGKRPLMGEAAAKRSRLVIVTEDDSRSEDPASIYDAIATGAESAGKRWGDDLLVIGDRREAIAEAFRRARPGDVVLLAGKGHETWNMGPNGPEPWSEREVAESLLR